jgi:hypothetical protein
MSNFVSKVAIFAVGAVVGSAVTWHFAKTKYERIAREEIDSVVDAYEKKLADKPEKTHLHIDAKLDEKTAEFLRERKDHIKKTLELGYVSNFEEKGEPVAMNRPYVISPDEYDENGYETISLTYYADKILADDMDEVIEDVDEVVGYDSLNRFGEYEEDCVFVRNDERRVDYEICLDTRNYSDVASSSYPHPVDE